MSLCRRFVRAKEGMSTVFGGLFFIIILLMGFNLMVWGFVQYDSYNQVLSKMAQNDQSAASENLVPANPGATNFNSAGSGSFNVTVNNLGGTSVSIARIYITNISPTGSSQCNSNPCIVDPSPGAATCVGSTNCNLSNGNVAVGEINHQIKITGLLINDGSGYKVVLSSTRGRLYSFYYPWPATPTGGGSGGTFVTNIGPLSLYFDYKSFNFTQGSQTSSQSAFCVPSGQTILLWVKMVNQATDSDVKLEPNTIIQAQPYTANGFGKFVRTWIVDPGSVNPNNIVGYNFNTNPYLLPAASANGPGAPIIVKFGGGSQGGTGGVSFGQSDNWLMFIGFYYLYKGQVQGQTIPFMNLKDTSGYPGSC